MKVCTSEFLAQCVVIKKGPIWVNFFFCFPNAAGEISERLDGTISDVITGRKPGRESRNEKVLVIVQGMASCDLALARLIYDKLRESEDVQRIVM